MTPPLSLSKFLGRTLSDVTSTLPHSRPLSLQDNNEPVMCSYKAVKVFFEVWGLQGRVESGVHRVREGTSCSPYCFV